MSDLQILCDACGHMVDEVMTYRDVCRMEHVVVVRCHGEIDEMRISDYDLMMFQKQLQGQTGKAFTNKKLEKRP